ncbi:MAG: FAD-dependent oxidoreductase [bacterium]|nr:FAD-dependent oxidoreductase [bacterium]
MGNGQTKIAENVVGSVMVVGGGIAGIQAAIDSARLGHRVYLVEKSSSLGGMIPQLHGTYPICVCCKLDPCIAGCMQNPNIEVLLNSQVIKVDGAAGNFQATVRNKETCNLKVGAIILSAGFEPFDPAGYDTYGYNRFPNVITSVEFEGLQKPQGPNQGVLRRPSDNKEPERIAWLQCVGSRDINQGGNGYCSSVCCMYALKEAVNIKEVKPEVAISIFYMDLRAYGKGFEDYTNQAIEKGVRLIRSRVHTVDPVFESDDLSIQYADEQSHLHTESFDLIVLSVGLKPAQKAVALAERLGIDLSPNRFIRTKPFEPVATSVPGIFVCGALSGPTDISNVVTQASAVAAKIGERIKPAAQPAPDFLKPQGISGESLDFIDVSVEKAALVVGGGVAGMESALTLAKQGYPVTLVEKQNRLGGHALSVSKTWQGYSVPDYLAKLINEVSNHPKIKLCLESEVVKTSGWVGNFKSEIRNPKSEIEHGVTILATGAEAIKPDEYLYGQNSKIWNWSDFDARIIKDPGVFEEAKTAVFIQCVGSREEQRQYCSRLCCTFSVRKAIDLKTKNPDMDIYVLYREMRTYGEREDIYKQARSAGVIFIRYTLEDKPQVCEKTDGNLEVTVQDHILNQPVVIEPDFICLQSAIASQGSENLSKLFKVALDKDGFFAESPTKLKPVDSMTDGVFLAGMALSPKSIEESIAQAQASAGRAMGILSRDTIQVGGAIAEVDPEKCVACLTCVRMCPFQVPMVDSGQRVVSIEPESCRGCGICVSECPGKAISLVGYTDQQLIAKTEQLLSS